MASAALAGLEAAQETIFFPACGTQAEGMKASEPTWSMPKASRDTEKKVYISKKHPQDSLGRDSPGPVYLVKRQKSLPSWGFGTAAQRPAPALAKFPESSNNLLGTMPDSQKFKYACRTASIGVCPRFGAPSNAPDLDGFPPGAISPGPQRYSPPPDSTYCHRMSWAPKGDQIPPRYSIRKKTKIIELESQTPAKVGPGVYPVPEACMPQARSEKPSLPRWSFSKKPRFPEASKPDPGRLWDGTGDRKIQFNRAYSLPPSYSFGTSTRQHRKKTGNVILPEDRGPAAALPEQHQEHPPLPSRKDVLKYTDVPAGKN